MLLFVLGAGAVGWLAGESIRQGRRIRRGMGLTAEEYAREQQAFRDRYQPPPAGSPGGGYVSCVPNADDRKAREALCKIAGAMEEALASPTGEATSERERAAYQDAFDKAWGRLTDGQRRCMDRWIKENCPRLLPLIYSMQARPLAQTQAQPQPPQPSPPYEGPGQRTPTQATQRRSEPVDNPLYAQMEITSVPGAASELRLVPRREPREFPVAEQVRAPTRTGYGVQRAAERGAEMMRSGILSRAPIPTPSLPAGAMPTASWGPASGGSLGPTGAAMAVTGPQVPLPYGGGMPGVVGAGLTIGPGGPMAYGGPSLGQGGRPGYGPMPPPGPHRDPIMRDFVEEQEALRKYKTKLAAAEERAKALEAAGMESAEANLEVHDLKAHIERYENELKRTVRAIEELNPYFDPDYEPPPAPPPPDIPLWPRPSEPIQFQPNAMVQRPSSGGLPTPSLPAGAMAMPTASWGPASGSSLGPTGAAQAVTGPQVPLPYGGGMPGVVGAGMTLGPSGPMAYGGALSGRLGRRLLPAGGGTGTL